MRIAVWCPPTETYLRLYRQAGVTDIVSALPAQEQGPVWEFLPLLHLRNRVEEAGLTLSVIESIPVPDSIKLGLPDRDRDLECFCKSLRNMGAAGIPILCYNWMAVLSVLRTSFAEPVRGGAASIAYDHSEMAQQPMPEAGPVSEQTLWSALEYFLKVVVPVAEEVGVKLAMHPDDPPISGTRGIGRIMTSPANFQRLIGLAPSANNGLTYCQGCFAEMGADIPATIAQFCGQRRMFFAHFRNLKGTLTHFVETFHDEGDTDMFAAMKAYADAGFDGPMRPDHVPAMEGETHGPGSYQVSGRLLAIGYMRGLMEGVAKSAPPMGSAQSPRPPTTR